MHTMVARCMQRLLVEINTKDTLRNCCLLWKFNRWKLIGICQVQTRCMMTFSHTPGWLVISGALMSLPRLGLALNLHLCMGSICTYECRNVCVSVYEYLCVCVCIACLYLR